MDENLKSTQSAPLMWAPPKPSFVLQILWITLGLFFFLEAVVFLKISARNGVTKAVCSALFCWTSTQSFPETLKDDQRALPAPMQVFPLNPVHRLFVWKRHFCPDKSAPALYLVLWEVNITQTHDYPFASQMSFLNSELVFASWDPEPFLGWEGGLGSEGWRGRKAATKPQFIV